MRVALPRAISIGGRQSLHCVCRHDRQREGYRIVTAIILLPGADTSHNAHQVFVAIHRPRSVGPDKTRRPSPVEGAACVSI